MKISRKKKFEFMIDLINEFNKFAFILDHYFKKEENKKLHKDLYLEYVVFKKNLDFIIKKYTIGCDNK